MKTTDYALDHREGVVKYSRGDLVPGTSPLQSPAKATWPRFCNDRDGLLASVISIIWRSW